jgi:hypothetical protein
MFHFHIAEHVYGTVVNLRLKPIWESLSQRWPEIESFQ